MNIPLTFLFLLTAYLPPYNDPEIVQLKEQKKLQHFTVNTLYGQEVCGLILTEYTPYNPESSNAQTLQLISCLPQNTERSPFIVGLPKSLSHLNATSRSFR